MSDLTPQTWTPKQMGSEGWAVFRSHPRRPSLDVMLCTGLTETDAQMIASAPALQRRVEVLVHATALSTHEEGCISTYGHAGEGLDYLCDDLFNEQCECGVAEGLRNLLDADTIEAVRRKRAALAASPTGEDEKP